MLPSGHTVLPRHHRLQPRHHRLLPWRRLLPLLLALLALGTQEAQGRKRGGGFRPGALERHTIPVSWDDLTGMAF